MSSLILGTMSTAPHSLGPTAGDTASRATSCATVPVTPSTTATPHAVSPTDPRPSPARKGLARRGAAGTGAEAVETVATAEAVEVAEAAEATGVVRPLPAPGRRVLGWRLRFGILASIWGFSFLLIKIGTQAYAPFQVTLGRLFFGAVVLVVAMVVKRQRLPRSLRTWAHLAVAALLLNAAPFSLFAYAELTIPSTLAGICNATSPLWGMLLSLVALSEDRPSRRRVAGLGIGFLGVLTVLGVWQGFSGLDVRGTLLALLASLSYPVGWIYVRRTLAGSRHSHLTLTGGQLLLATVELAVVTPVFTSLPARFPLLPLLAVVALGALGTGLAMLIQYGLVHEVGPTTAQMVTYFVPVIATAAGVALLGESLSWSTPVGAAVVIIGAALTQSRPRRSQA